MDRAARRSRGASAIRAAVGALAAACGIQSCRFPAETIECRTAADCTAGTDARCEDDRRCSYHDAECPSERRYGAYSAGRGRCVPAEDGGSGGSGGSGGAGNGGTTGGGGDVPDGSTGGGGTTPDASVAPEGTLRLIAGQLGGWGTIDGRGSQARFAALGGLAFDGERFLYLTDSLTNTIRRVDTRTADVVTLAGSDDGASYADGSFEDARFSGPEAVAYDGSGSGGPVLYVTERSGNRLRKLDLTLRTVSTVAGSPEGVEGKNDGIGAAATFSGPEFIARGAGSILYLADGDNNLIRTVDVATGEVKTLAGDAAGGEAGNTDGPALAARFDFPYGLAFDRDKNRLFIGDHVGERVRVLDLGGGAVSTLITEGLEGPAALVHDAANDRLYVNSEHGSWFGVIDVTAKTLTKAPLKAGPGFTGAAPGADVSLDGPMGLVAVPNGFFVTDYGSSSVRRLVAAAAGAYELTDFAGLPAHPARVDATGSDARFGYTGDIVLLPDAKTLLVADTTFDLIRAVDVTTREVTTYAGSGTYESKDGAGAAASFMSPEAMTVAPEVPGQSPVVFVSQSSGAVRKIDTANAAVTTVFAGGEGFVTWSGLAASETTIYATDEYRYFVAQIPAAGGAPVTLVGVRDEQGCEDGEFALARFSAPRGIAWDGPSLYVADYGCKAVRRVNLESKTVETVAGGATAGLDGTGNRARFRGPTFLVWDRSKSGLFVGDEHIVRHLDVRTYAVKTVAGSPDRGGGVWLSPSPTALNFPSALAQGVDGELYLMSELALLRWDAR